MLSFFFFFTFYFFMPYGSGVCAAFTTKIPTAAVTALTYFKSLALICLDKDNTASMPWDQDSIL